MRLADITGVTEKTAITISKGCQVICIKNATAELVNEEIEVSLVDFVTGKETTLLRKDKLRMYGEVTEQGGNKRPTNSVLIEVSDGRDLDLNAQKVLRINLTSLTALNTYEMYAIESGVPNGLPCVYEQLILPQGVNSQKFPIPDGDLLLLPTVDLKDIQVMYTDGTEYRATAEELTIKAIATNGATIASGAVAIYIIDLVLQNEFVNKRVSHIEVNLFDHAGGYTMYKIHQGAKPGFDWKF